MTTAPALSPPVVPAFDTPEAIVVLGCRVRLDPTGRLSGAVLRARVERAATEYARRAGERTVVVASGGRRWGEHVEADVMARELQRRGVPGSAIVRERASLSTRDNARFVALALSRRGIDSASVVTSDWHLPRAVALFQRTGLRVVGVPAPAEPGREGRWPAAAIRGAREGVLALLERLRP